ncbi:MAG: acetamidase/formamidase family protein [Devosia sp.]
MHSSHHTIHGQHFHYGWDKSFPPVDTIAPGTTLRFECKDSGSGHFTPKSTIDAVSTLDFGKVNPVTGPIFIDGAAPGDILKVTIEAFEPSGFGWTAIIPGFGLLADQFTTANLTLWSYDIGSMAPAAFSKGGKVPLKPFAGTIGVAPAEAGLHSIVPPRRVGGNMDIRDLSAGSVLYLPVEVAGGLFSVGDTHAAQGDGEVCGTAIESAMNVTLGFDLIKQTPLAMPRFTTPGPVTRHLDAKGYEVTTGIGPDLVTGARNALSNMIDLLGHLHGLTADDAYMLCSVAGDLRISEVVDMPNWVVSFYFPRLVFE